MSGKKDKKVGNVPENKNEGKSRGVCVCELNKNHLKIQVSASLTKFLSFFNGHPIQVF